LVTSTIPFGESITTLKDWVKDINWTTEYLEVVRMLTAFFTSEKSVGTLVMIFSRSGVVNVDGLLDSEAPKFSGND
jgi:hypothetical protein